MMKSLDLKSLELHADKLMNNNNHDHDPHKQVINNYGNVRHQPYHIEKQTMVTGFQSVLPQQLQLTLPQLQVQGIYSDIPTINSHHNKNETSTTPNQPLNSIQLVPENTFEVNTQRSINNSINSSSSNPNQHNQSTEHVEGKVNDNVSEQQTQPATLSSSSPPTSSSPPSTESTANDEFSKEQPDPDNIKMFVGQIPKTLDETQLKKMFEQFGRVHTINVLRDKVTGVSKGCCFVTYFTRKAALRAQDALHNIKTLDGMHHPIQMKPADSENRNERKLFVGMLNKKYNESDVRQLFSGHGVIEECTVLRDQNGQSKGCAFVTFATKQSAIGAIKSLHQSKTMEGCSAPLVVKFADTQKEKEQKKLQQLQIGLWNAATGPSGPQQSANSTNNLHHQIVQTIPTSAAVAPTQLAQNVGSLPASQPLIAANPPTQQQTQFLSPDATTPLHLFHQLPGLHQPQLLQGLNAPPELSALTAATGNGLFSIPNLLTLASFNHHHHNHNNNNHQQHTPHHPSAAAALAAAASGAGPEGLSFLPPGLAHLTAENPFGPPSQMSNSALAAATNAAIAGAVNGKQTEGPEGSNLFIYHLPQEFTDTDLATTFLPFGSVLSAKVFIDKNTNKSKCFGFVSYDNSNSAHAAIKAMNGFVIGTKRLKVQLKNKRETTAKPY
ncbi:hypothetical protein ACFFRR_003734 [Megaselia abdita]